MYRLRFAAAGAALAAASLGVATPPASAGTDAPATEYMTWYNTATSRQIAVSPGPCRNVDGGTPYWKVINRTSQGQIVWQLPNCQGVGVRLTPTLGSWKVEGGEWRSYSHT